MDTKSNDDSGGSDSLDKSMQRKCVMEETSSTSSECATERDTCSRDSDSAALGESPPGEPTTDSCETVSNTEEGATGTTGDGNMNTASNTAFDTTVTLISQNLRETTLAESETDATAATSSTINTPGTPDHSSSTDCSTSDTLTSTSTDVDADECDQRSKKVSFHPDVKANDGGNRVKKKRRSAQASDGDSDNQSCDGMDLDVDNEEEDEDDEKEEEFSMARTMAEADDYLRQHPLTFARRKSATNGEALQEVHHAEEMHDEPNGDAPYFNDIDHDYYIKCKPENGIESILGKEIRAGRVEYLLRYENQGGLFWESEEFIRRTCPTLLRAYEKNREWRQQRLMQHVAIRQATRQRYTDF
ncbi:A16 [Drosophila busckii]|uniref:A16 n=1 Tax=Drosophila busckii TaxID=30019 RepID=A0A0M5IWL2_DROBS|nr:serine-aspartate repeat-containing protein C [Drosophila busckii]ALC39456.1 A16 [Drosophila busckii]